MSANYFLTSSASASTGIRIWDLRYQKIASSPVQTFLVPQRMSKESGVASICWDRFRSSLFAICTDNAIYEYIPALCRELPGWPKFSNFQFIYYFDFQVRSLRTKNVSSFFVQCSASPVSDHLLCGSSYENAYIWNLQVRGKYRKQKKKSFL